jgi:molybdopterin synthase catalytic subunit
MPALVIRVSAAARLAPTRAEAVGVRLTVLLFAAYREAAGTGRLEIDIQDSLTARDVWQRLAARHGALDGHLPSAAINGTYASLDDPVRAGDEVAFLPPVSGG